jgi:hypothetical protein
MRPLSRAFLRRLFAVGCLSAAAVACAISPKPEPPDAATELDPGVIGIDSGDTRGGGIVVRGEPGAASPPGAIVRIYNLDSDAPPVETRVEQDGSFEAVVPGEVGDQVRVQVIGEQSRSSPADVSEPLLQLGGPGDTTEGGAWAAESCVLLEPPAELVIETSGAVAVRNSCSTEIQVDAPYPRVEAAGLALGAEQSWPVALAPGAELSFTVQIDPSSGFVEEIIFVPVTVEQLERHAITVHVPD